MKLFSTAFICIVAYFSISQVLINEVSCSNRGNFTDSFGENEDWIELLNVGAAPVDLTGFYLTDNPNNVVKFQIGAVTLNAGQRIMVHCSGRNITLANEIHTNFKLSQTSGDVVMLSGPSGAFADSVHLANKLTKANHSIGRSIDGASDWKLFTTPTPNNSNTGAEDFYMPRCSFSLAPGFYSGPQSVSISFPAGAQVRYTLDGSDPNAGSTLYASAISITSTTVLRAKTFGTNLESMTTTSTYFIDENHTIPVVSIAGQGLTGLLVNGNGGSNEPSGSFELFEDDGSFIDAAEGSFNKHGNDSWAYAQRGFDYIARDEFGDGDAIRHQIYPSKARTKFKRLILKPAANDNYPFANGAHVRDAFVQTLSHYADLKVDERTWRPCVLYLNGSYHGVYEIREKYDDHNFTGFYYNQDEFFGENQVGIHFLKTWGATWEEYGQGQAQNEWDNLRTYINGNSMANQTNFNYVDSLYNWRSLVDYFVLNSFIVSKDWLNWNTAWWRGRNPDATKKKWRYTLWDMDASFGHYVNYTGIPDESANANPCNAENLPNPGGQGHTELLIKLINEQPIVHQYYITRYIDLNNTYFSCDYTIPLLDSMLNTFASEMPRQISLWGGTLSEYQNNVQELKDFISNRCTAINNGLVDCYDLIGPYELVIDVSPVGAGEVMVNSIWAPTYPWTAEYFGNIETLLKASPATGFEFDHWEYNTGPLLSPIEEDTNAIDVQGNDLVTAVFRPIEQSYASNSVHLPNAFSPNDDGNNDYLIPFVGEDVLSFEIRIYDRWGNLILKSSDPAMKWDGRFNGRLLNTGVLAYAIEITYQDETTEIKSGNITLIR